METRFAFSPTPHERLALMSIQEYFGRHVRLRHLRLLVAIDDAGRLTAAAKALYITQPALSKALSEVEKALGEAVFERTPRGLAATRSGAALIRSARLVLAELDRASLELQQLGSSGGGTVVVGAMPTVSTTFLGEAIARLAQLRPAITVRVVDGLTPFLLSELAAGRLDVAVGGHMRSAVPEGVRSVPLYVDRMQIAISSQHPLARARSPSWAQCLAFPWVLPPPHNAVAIEFYTALRRLKLPNPEHVIEALSGELSAVLMERADALVLMPQRMVQALEDRGVARSVGGPLSGQLNVRLPIKAFMSATEGESEGVTELLHCIRTVLRESPRKS